MTTETRCTYCAGRLTDTEPRVHFPGRPGTWHHRCSTPMPLTCYKCGIDTPWYTDVEDDGFDSVQTDGTWTPSEPVRL